MKFKLITLLLLYAPHLTHALTCPEIQQEFITTKTLTGALLSKVCILKEVIDNNIPSTCSKIDVVQSIIDGLMIDDVDLPCPAIPIRAGDATSGGTLSLVGTGTTFVLQNNIDFALSIEDSNITVDLCGKEINFTGDAITASGQSNITIKNGKVSGDILISGGSDIRINGLDITPSGTGIDINGSEKVRIADCVICDGVHALFLEDVQEALIQHVIASGASGSSFVGTSTAVAIEQCIFDSSADDGLSFSNSDNVAIRECQFTDNAGHGVHLLSTRNILVDRCLLVTSTTAASSIAALQLSNADGGLISNCYIKSDADTQGIRGNSTSTSIKIVCCCLVGTDTFISGQNGIDIDGDDFMVKQCSVSNFSNGIVANTNSTRICVLDCVTQNCGIGYQAASGSTDAFFQRNKANGNTIAGFENVSSSSEFLQNVGNQNGSAAGVGTSSSDYVNSSGTYFDLATTVTGSTAFGGTGPASAWVNIFKG